MLVDAVFRHGYNMFGSAVLWAAYFATLYMGNGNAVDIGTTLALGGATVVIVHAAWW